MATKPAVLEQQRNRELRGVPTSAPLPAMVDSDGRITNAAGFAGFSVQGGPSIECVPVLSLPDANCTLTADQLVGAHVHTINMLADRVINLPSAADILKYLTNANARSSVHFAANAQVNLGTVAAPGAVIPENATPIPFFKTVFFSNPVRTHTVNLGAGCVFKNDLSRATNSPVGTLHPTSRFDTEFYWYILDATASPPVIAVVSTA